MGSPSSHFFVNRCWRAWYIATTPSRPEAGSFTSPVIPASAARAAPFLPTFHQHGANHGNYRIT
jgi:hypothetical protein